jgi:O-antigen/teichoic acid export membrane protein
MSLLRKALLVNGTEFVCLGLSIVQAAILARVLGPAGIGQYDLIRSALILAPQLCCFGFPLSFLYHSQHDPENTKKYLMNTMCSILFVSIIGGVTLPLVVLFKKDYFGFVPWFALISIGLYVPILLAGMTARNILLIKIEARKLALMRILSVLGGLALILGFYAFGSLGVSQALLCFIFAAFVNMLVGWTWTRRQVDLSVKPSWKTSWQLGSMGIRLSWVDLMVLLNAQVNILIVKYLLANFESVGYFSRALRIAMLAVLAGQAVLPLLFSRWASFPEERVSTHVEKVMRFASTISITMIFGTLFFGKWIVLLLYGARFLPAVVPMMILVPGAVLYLLSKTLVMLLGSRGAPELSALSLLIGIIVNVALSFLLIPLIGISGAAWASTISNILLLLLLMLIVRKKYKIELMNCLCVNRKDVEGISKSLLRRRTRGVK